MTRDYIGGIEYVNDTLDAIYHSEGRIKYIDEAWCSTMMDISSKLQSSNNRAGNIERENDTRDTIQQIKNIKILLQKNGP